MEKNSLYIVMPAYNEEANIEKVIRKWYVNTERFIDMDKEKSKLVIADSGSTDRTHEILTGLTKEFPNLVILDTKDKQHGPKLIELYRYAIDHGADYVFQTDSDDQTDPWDFDKFWRHKKEYDAIFGWRKERGDGKWRAFVEKTVCFLLFCVFGIKVPDANAPYRLYKCRSLKKYIKRLPEDYAIPNIMLTAFYACDKESIIAFTKIHFDGRRAGKNSIDLIKIIKIGIKAVWSFIGFRKSVLPESKA